MNGIAHVIGKDAESLQAQAEERLRRALDALERGASKTAVQNTEEALRLIRGLEKLDQTGDNIMRGLPS